MRFKWVPTTHIYKSVLFVPIWNASVCHCNSNEYPQHIYESICCWYPFEMHQIVCVIQMSTHNIYIYKRMLLVPIWIASTCQWNSDECPQHIYKRIWYPFEMHQLVSAIQMSAHNIYIKGYVVGTHLKCINLSIQLKWVPTTYIKHTLLVPIWKCINFSMQFKWVSTMYI